jgi:hypothetical protein
MRKYFLAALGLISAILCLNDGLAALDLGANSLLVGFYLIFAAVQAGAAIWLLVVAKRLALSVFVAVFLVVALFDLLMLQPVRSVVDYLGVLILILGAEYWIVLRRGDKHPRQVAS